MVVVLTERTALFIELLDISSFGDDTDVCLSGLVTHPTRRSIAPGAFLLLNEQVELRYREYAVSRMLQCCLRERWSSFKFVKDQVRRKGNTPSSSEHRFCTG
ncbi:hypothetical protein XI05_01815 [Bradyrhizobium sp. CCBAU 11357]|nr:hypothetical protein [Bradyrhizobium sp. CCBAU 11357]